MNVLNIYNLCVIHLLYIYMDTFVNIALLQHHPKACRDIDTTVPTLSHVCSFSQNTLFFHG